MPNVRNSRHPRAKSGGDSPRVITHDHINIFPLFICLTLYVSQSTRTGITMVKFYDSLSPELGEWCMAQPLFYTASAPLHGSHINISPKGLPSTTFSILDANTAAYIDATGSGAETIAHLYENGRCTIMFCSFEKTPRILRLFCKGRVVEFWDEEFGVLTRGMGKEVPVGARAVIVLEIFKVRRTPFK